MFNRGLDFLKKLFFSQLPPDTLVFIMKWLRYWIMAAGIALAGGAYVYELLFPPRRGGWALDLGDFYGLTAFTLLYAALIITPLFAALPHLTQLRALAIKSRRAVGVSAALYALLHGTVLLFWYLGGFEGLLYLDTKYLISVLVGTSALLILCVMAATSFDAMVAKLGRRWKQLHRFVYLAGLLIMIHVAIFSGHGIITFGILVLLGLECLRMYRFCVARYYRIPTHTWRLALWGLYGFLAVGTLLLQLLLIPHLHGR